MLVKSSSIPAMNGSNFQCISWPNVPITLPATGKLSVTLRNVQNTGLVYRFTGITGLVIQV